MPQMRGRLREDGVIHIFKEGGVLRPGFNLSWVRAYYWGPAICFRSPSMRWGFYFRLRFGGEKPTVKGRVILEWDRIDNPI